jgi:predicted transcriptional regulator
MSTAQILFDALQGLSIKQQRRISDLSGVPWRTLYKIKRGFTADPKSTTCDRLLAVLRTMPPSSNVVVSGGKSSAVAHIAEEKVSPLPK